MPEQTCAYEGCHRPIYQNSNFPQTDKCIFHCEKKAASKFRAYAQTEIAAWLKTQNKFDFNGWVFVGTEWTVLFRGIEIYRDVKFDAAVFVDGADFERTKFFCKVSFKGTHFQVRAKFDKARFTELALFQETVFEKGVSFQDVSFENDAHFIDIQLSNFLDVAHARFRHDAKFVRTKILGSVKLTWPGSGKTYDLDGNRLTQGALVFENLEFVPSEDSILDLRDLPLHDQCGLTVCNTSVEHSAGPAQRLFLTGTDCRLIKFRNVQWPIYKSRRVSGDELLERAHPKGDKRSSNWNDIAVTYQQLTIRYRGDLDHPGANDFERGIFEARLMAAKQVVKLWRSRWLLQLYKAASNFGGSIWRPAWIAGVLLVVCAWVYGGFMYGDFFVLPRNWDLRTAWDSLVAAMRVVSLDRSWFSREVDTSGAGSFARLVVSTVAIVQTALTATLVTLFIFAIRRRFKHSE
ncbi:MAG TPA: pentapeptide repeat-containing protein [bacterium]